MKVQEEMHQWMIRRANKAVKSYQGRLAEDGETRVMVGYQGGELG